jgi:hypothetical protein
MTAKANGKITSGDLKLVGAVSRLVRAEWRGLAGGSVLAGDVAAALGQPVETVKRDAARAQAHGVASIYTYQGETRIGLSNEGWELTQPRRRT